MRFTRQPQYPARIDRGNPISRGLIFEWNGAVQNLEGATGIIGGNVGTLSGTTSRLSKGMSVAANSYIDFPHNVQHALVGDLTVFALVLPTSTGADSAFVAKNATNGATNSPFIAGMLTGGAPLLGRANSGYRVWSGGTNTLAANVPCSVAISQGSDISVAPRFYTNGIFDTAAAVSNYGGSGSGAPTDTGMNTHVGNRADNTTPWPGGIFLIFLWNRILSDAEILSLNANPWQLFLSPARQLYGLPNTSGSSGTLAYTNANDSLAASGTTTITGTLAKTNANDTLAASGAVGSNITGTVAVTNVNDSLAAAGTTTITGSLAKTNANDSVAASGTTAIVGLLARTNANDTLVASGIAGAITGTVAYTNVNDSASASGVGNPNAQASGGFFEVPHVKRRTTVQEDRERLGIIPKKIKRVIEAVAQQSVSQEKTDIQAQLLLAEKLAKQDIEAKARYAEFMRQERDRILARDIKLALLIRAKQQADDEDDEYAVEMLLL